MRKTLRAFVLVLAFSAPAFAGDIPMVPAPQPGMTAEEPAAGGDIPTPSATEESTTQTVLSLFESLLALI